MSLNILEKLKILNLVNSYLKTENIHLIQFLKPIKNLVNYTENIKEKSKKKIDIKSLIKRNDELGTLSLSLDE